MRHRPANPPPPRPARLTSSNIGEVFAPAPKNQFNVLPTSRFMFLVIFIVFPIFVFIGMYGIILVAAYLGNFDKIFTLSDNWQYPIVKILGIPMIIFFVPVVIIVNYITYISILRFFQRERREYFGKVELIIESLPASLFLRQVNGDGSSQLIYRGGRYHEVYRTRDDDARFDGDIFPSRSAIKKLLKPIWHASGMARRCWNGSSCAPISRVAGSAPISKR